MGQWMDGFVKKLEKIRRENIAAGGIQQIEAQHNLGKLTVRERIDKLEEQIKSLVNLLDIPKEMVFK